MNKKVRHIIGLLFIFLNLNVYSQNEIIDSLNLKDYNSSDNLKKIQILNDYIKDNAGVSPQICYELAWQNLQNALNFGYNYEKAITYNSLGKTQKILGFHQDALKSYLNEKNYIDIIKDTLLLANNLKDIGETYRALSDFKKAEESIKQSLNLNKLKNNEIGIAECYDRLGSVYYELFTEKKEANIIDSSYLFKSIQFCGKSLEIAYQLNDSNLISSSLTIMGAVYSSRRIMDSTHYYLSKSVFYAKQPIDFANIYINIARFFLRAKSYDSTRVYAEKALKIALNTEFYSSVYYSADLLADAFYNTRKLDSAFKYAKFASRYKMKGYNTDKKIEALQFEASFKERQRELSDLEQLKSRKYAGIAALIILLFLLIFALAIARKNKKLKMANQELLSNNEVIENQRKMLHELNATKDKFFSIIAHDLKNPLGAFKHLTQTLVSEFDNFSPQENKDLIRAMENSSNRLYELLENLLEWSRAQRGNIPYNPENINISKLVDFSVQSLKLNAENKKIDLKIDIDNNIEVYSDLNLGSTVIRNLTSNAIKFTPHNGSIIIKCKEIENYIEVLIEDTGIGMSSEKLGKLFKIGEVVSAHGTDNETGTGLGLILCKEFIEKNRGYLKVESIEGVGTTFVVGFPINNNN